MPDPVKDPERLWVVLRSRDCYPTDVYPTQEEAHEFSVRIMAVMPRGDFDRPYTAHESCYVSLSAHEAALSEQVRRIAELEKIICIDEHGGHWFGDGIYDKCYRCGKERPTDAHHSGKPPALSR